MFASGPPGPSGQPMRPMNTMPTFRRGRRVYRPGPNDNGGLGGVCSVLFVVLLLLVPPLVLLVSEANRHGTYVALKDALHSDVVPLAPDAKVGDFVHGSSCDIDAAASDRDMGVSVPGALALRRRTEYCQWQEIQRRECDRCTRTVRASDGATKEESYECNCVTAYDYVKSWRSRRINSMLFDQPAAHHNPQRDPMPPRTFAADEAVLRMDGGGGEATDASAAAAAAAILDPAMLSKGVRGARWRPVDFVPHGTPPVPPFWRRWIPDRTRYEPASALRNILNSPAAREDNFVYVGRGGYFFSPFAASTAENLFKYFVEYMEGTLFDWQIGDVMPSCTAGDVRFYYEVQDPAEVSVLGEVAGRRTGGGAVLLQPRVAENGRAVGLVHAGAGRSVPAMIAAEDSDSRWTALFPRLLLVPWAAASSRLLGALLGRDVGCSGWPTQTAAAAAVWCVAVGSVWVRHWGWTVSVDAPFLLLGACLLGLTARRHAPRSDAPGGPNAVWCMLGRWANVPPSWRVERSYHGGMHGKGL